ncbi:MAG: hypothetical protein AAF533_01115 [Acidobacteriota bacterium]
MRESLIAGVSPAFVVTHAGSRLIRRFLADVRLQDGTELTALAVPGHRVLLSDSGNPRRKLCWTLELIHVGTSWVGVNTVRANELVEEGRRLDRRDRPRHAS